MNALYRSVRRRSKRALTQCCLVLGIVMCALSLSSSEASFPLDNGEHIDFDNIAGKWVVIAYWAIWCGPCREEIRILNGIHRQRDKYNVVVLGMNFDGVKGEELAAQKARFNAEYPDLLVDPRARWNEPRPDFIPVTLIIDPQGELREVIIGSTTRREILGIING